MNKNIKDITGQKFGRLFVIGLDVSKKSRASYWVCQCDCGTIKSVRGDSLKAGKIKSCGCLKREQDRINLTKHHSHKQSGTRLYGIWTGMKDRCHNEHNARYSTYGGRGITVCDDWDNSFSNFYEWSLSNGYKEHLTIDRINNDGNYCPDNCRWTDNKNQCRNRTTNVNIKIGNSTRTLTEWCEIFELNYGKISARYQRNKFISIDDLFNS